MIRDLCERLGNVARWMEKAGGEEAGKVPETSDEKIYIVVLGYKASHLFFLSFHSNFILASVHTRRRFTLAFTSH